MSEKVPKNKTITTAAGAGEKDSRTSCKYGARCYQKNPEHLAKFRHPSKVSKEEEATSTKNEERATKKRKLNNTEQTDTKKEVISDSGSDDDDENEIKQVNSSSDEVASDSNTSEVDKKSTKSEDVISESDNESVTKENQTSGKTAKETISDSDSEYENNQTKTLNCHYSKETSKKFTKSSDDCDDKTEAFNPKKFIKNRFLVEMPDDFYKFWDFCKGLKESKPHEALKGVGLTLVGPFDVLAGKFKAVHKQPEEYLRHWRYYYDPPEFQTVLKGDDSDGYHIGYFRDSPQQPPVFLCSNCGKVDGIFTKMGDNIFAAVDFFLEKISKSADPFKKITIERFKLLVKDEAKTLKLDLSQQTKEMLQRNSKVVSPTLNKIGLVVPYNRKTQMGFRTLAKSDKEITALLTKIKDASPEQKVRFRSDFQEVLTYATIAIDECDFGTGIKLGWDILAHGIDDMDATILGYLVQCYNFIDRQAFAKIAEAHLSNSNRKKGSSLSIV